MAAGREIFVARKRDANSSVATRPKKSRCLKCGSGHRDLIGSKRPYQLVSKVGPDRVGGRGAAFRMWGFKGVGCRV